MTKVLLFDVMSTLVSEPFLADMPRFFGMSLDELIRLKDPTAFVAFERGEIDEAEYAARFFSDGRTIDVEGLKRCLRESYQWIDGMEALVAELAERRVEMHTLSNYSVWYRLIEERLELSRFVSWTFVSCHTGVRKPDADAYLGAARKLGVPPADCLFVDDRKKNCAGAEAVGMPAVLFESAAQLRAELAARGIR